ncbi:MAG: hypothetical protein HZB83_03565 [Deltaproteobacteria bacterium]|nr:hypothetical protein [Deltaproteobacteria bacterium]
MKKQTEKTARRKLLVVDADELIREVCSLVLTETGYEVETAAHGIEAMERLKG